MKIMVQTADLERDRDVLIATLRHYLTPASNESRFEWLYRQNPHGAPKVWLARDSNTGEIVGSSAAFRRRLVVNGSAKPGWVLGDFCVANKYRSMGPALQLQRATLYAVGQEAELCYDFPSRQMAALYSRLGIQPVAQMVRMAKPLLLDRKMQKLTGSPALARSASWLGNLMLRFSDYRFASEGAWDIALHRGECGDEFTSLRKTATLANRIEIQKTAEYLNWRYLRHPLARHQVLTARHSGELKGYLIFSCEQACAEIEDWYTGEDTSLLQALAQELVRLLRKAGVTTLSASLLETDPRLPVLKRMGFWRRESCPVVVYGPGAGPVSTADWLMTNGDRDL
jgi:hypothetical protein